jgi:HEXXH motif-containing protein
MPPDSQRALAAAASLALYLAQHGRQQHWRLTLARPESLLFSHYQLPAGTRVVFDADGESANMLVSHKNFSRRVRASRFRGEWRADGAEALLCLQTGEDAVLLLSQLPGAIDLRDGVVIFRPDDETGERYGAAFDFLSRFAPVYLPWVQRVVSAIVPVQSVPGHTYSQSFEFLPGVVALSEKALAIELAVCLVRETAHQYCEMVRQSAPVPEADPEMEKLVSDYHACANIYLFYRECRSHGFDDPEFCLVREQFLKARLVQLQEHLQQAEALSPVAHALLRPLSARL